MADNDNLSARQKAIAEARQYLETGGLGEVIGLTSVALDAEFPKVQSDTAMAMALCFMAADRPPWQPIESAPKDGTNILLMLGETIPHLPDIRVGSYLSQAAAHELGEPGPTWLIWDTAFDRHCETAPTHWMPLPAPPAGGADG